MEQQLVAWIRQNLQGHERLLLGPGDDAAVLAMAGDDRLVVTVDMLTDGVDFLLAEVDPRRVGRKALAVNLSDLAAMAARPLAVVIAAVLPKSGGRALAEQLYQGIIPLAEQYNVAIAGGDTNSWDGPLVLSITALGTVTPRGPLTRSGARPGDRIVVTGSFGGSILGRQFDFTPRIHEALLLNERYDLHAGMDVSDGLALDLSRLIRESKCGAVVETDRVPIHEDAYLLAKQQADGRTPLDHALGDGEDFELILAVPPHDAQRMLADQPLAARLTDIGEYTTNPGLWQRTNAGTIVPLKPIGWEHEL
jgi:thiamine-monophosphate kinase